MKIAIILLSIILFAMPVFASTLDGYDRAKIADENYSKMNGSDSMPESKNDPELAAIMKKYIYGDLSQQIKLSDMERQLIRIVVLTTNQNHKFLARVINETLALGIKPIEIREALYHVAPYIGFPKVFEALDIANEIFTAKGVKLPLENQGTTTDSDRFEKGLNFQVASTVKELIK